MVTPAGKELLKNTINTAKFHNKILEENDMWRQWELEKGLTMMVSDDAIRKGHHRCRYHEKLRNAKLEKMRHKSRNKDSHCSDSPADKERWDHSGFAELYPDEIGNGNSSREQVTDKATKRRKMKEESSSSSDSDSGSSQTSSSVEEVWEEFPKPAKATSKSYTHRHSSLHCKAVKDSHQQRLYEKHERRQHNRHKRKKSAKYVA